MYGVVEESQEAL